MNPPGQPTVDIRSLDPQTRARQLGRPEGAIGIALADAMNSMNGPINMAAFRALAPMAGHHLLEIGFGNGKLIPDLLALAPALHYTGVDYSETMLAEAMANNREYLATGHVSLHLGSSASLPVADAAIDRALAINVIYFWADPECHFSEVFRVVKPGGAFVFNSMTPGYARTMPHTREEMGFHIHDRPKLIDLAASAGFSDVSVEIVRYVGVASTGQQGEREFHLVTAWKRG